ncbi:MAG: MBL fold metallo-hydrolase [Candidatus Omnitrophota bacterium]
MRIKLIASGSSKWQRFMRRWGISFLLGEDVIFDTFGSPAVFLKNMRRFNVSPSGIRHIVLSHEDWDHTGGLWRILPGRRDISVYVCASFRQELKDRIVVAGARIVETGGPTQISGDIYSTGELCYESGKGMLREQSLIIKTTGGLALVCGCAHPGLMNIIRRARDEFQSEVTCLIGGFHLKDNADKLNISIINELLAAGVSRIAPLHCTGRRAVGMMREAFGKGFVGLGEGGSIEL